MRNVAIFIQRQMSAEKKRLRQICGTLVSAHAGDTFS